MEILPGGLKLNIPEGCFPLSTDSMVLSDFVKLPKNASVLDLGAGCGTLGLLLCSKDPNCHVTGIEVTETAHRAALRNIEDNNLGGRMKSLCLDLRQISGELPGGSFSVCISNPPYFSGGPAAKLKEARREDLCSIRELLTVGAQALKFGGDFYLVHRPERLGEILGEGCKAGLECKRLRLLRHRENGPVALVLLSLRKGGKPGLILDELSLFDASGDPTEDYKRIYHMEEA